MTWLNCEPPESASKWTAGISPPDRREYAMTTSRFLVGLAIGLALALVQLILAFVPWSVVGVVALYGALGYWIATREPPYSSLFLWACIAPPWLLTLLFVVLAGNRLFDDVGTLHLANLAVIPILGFGGYLVGRASRERRSRLASR
jgi:hypothetical protein